MHRISLSLFLCALLTLPFAGFALGSEDVTLTGSFIWARNDGEDTGDLTAVFTPNKTDNWAVSFHFTWDGEDHLYLGTATGSLDSGALSGSARSDDEENKISFRFEGEFENGTFSGTHGWINEEGSLERAGTLTLAR